MRQPAGSVVGRTYRTPFGLLSVVTRDDVVVSSGFQSLAFALARLGGIEATSGAQDEVERALDAYLAGDLDALTSVRTAQSGGVFAMQAWRAMSRVPAGKVITYTDLAAKAGSPLAVRAAGSACARNAVAPFVPCHRVVKTGGAMGNYGYGIAVKAALLRFEGVSL